MPVGNSSRSASLISVTVRTQSRRAYTLIEIVIVLMIVAIVAAAAAPKFNQSIIKFRLRAVAQRITADLSHACRLAQRNCTPQQVAFDVAGNRYTLTSASHLDRQAAPYRFSLAALEYDCRLISANFGGSPTVNFNIFGRPSSAGTIVVRCGSTAQTLSVNEIGQVSVL